SAGNHAQGVALSGQRLGIPAIIVMPSTTPDIKVQAVKRLGGQVVLHGDSFDIANKYAQQRAEAEGLVFIPPYDDELVIAGQGTIANEILRQWRDVEYVFVAVGGGGLIAGVAAYLGDVAPHVKVIGVEYEESACLKAALEANERVVLPHVGLFADGTAVAQIGALPFDIVRLRKSDNSGPIVEPDIVTVNTDEICAAIKDTFDENRSIVEPSG
ncbi:pyridoxal-phosphate dependent enzyme, partial [Acinetobacter baumannii]